MKTIEQDLIKLKNGILFHQVNCLGIMGGGLAAQIAMNFPLVEKDYMDHTTKLKNNGINPLGTYLLSEAKPYLYIANIYGQKSVGMGRQTDYNAVDDAFKHLVMCEFDLLESNKLYFPYFMGCGLGGGDVKVYHEIIHRHFDSFDVYLSIWPPQSNANRQ